MADAIVPPPSEEEYNRGPRVQTNSGGIGYYIPPEIKQLGRSALDLVNMMDPVQGIMAGMRDSGRAFNPELSPEERKQAAVSAALETTFAAAPVAAAKLMKAPAKAALVDALTLTGAPTSMADDISDPSRRAFMKGAAATAGVAALAPEAITEALKKVPAAVKRVRGGGHMATVLEAVSKNRKSVDELRDKTFELSKDINVYLEGTRKTTLPIKVEDDEVRRSFEAMQETRDLQKEAYRLESVRDNNLMDLLSSIRNSPKILDDARDEDLEYFLEELDHFPFGIGERLEDPEFADIYKEIKKRGLDQRRNKDGVDEYPYSNMFVLDYEEGILGDGPITPKRFDSPVLKMTDRDSLPVEDLVARDQEDRNRELIRQALVREFEAGQEKGLSQAEIDEAISQKRYQLEKKYGIDFSKADGGEIKNKKSFNEMRASLEDALKNMPNEEFEKAYGQTKAEARDVLSALIIQRFHGASYDDDVPSSYRVERDAQVQQKKDDPVVSSTTGMVGLDANGNVIEYGKTEDAEMRKGVGSLSEIARHMTKGGVAASSTEYRRSLYGTESSGGALDAVNKRTGALGASQAMPETLEEFKEETGRDFTRDEFKKNAGLQEAFQNWYEQKTLDYIANNGLDQYIGKMVKGVPVTLSGMMAVAHLGGNNGLKQFLETDGGYDPSDNKKNPEQGTRLSDYLQKHGGLNVYSDDSLSEDAKEELVMSQPVAPRNPIYSDPDYSNPMNYMRPVARPTDLAPVFQNELNESPRPVARPQQEARLQEKYSPEGIEQLLIGTTAEPLLPRQFQQGSPSGVGR